jgi:hypothetical protein
VVYDDFFETVHATEEEPPAEWNDLVTFNRFDSEYDDEDYRPELSTEWLSPEELNDRHQRERESKHTIEINPDPEERINSQKSRKQAFEQQSGARDDSGENPTQQGAIMSEPAETPATIS